MVLESTMLCVDNSEYMRNGDFTPTRLQCQQDAANMIIQAKLRSNPENAVGLLSMGSEVEVHSSMSQEQPRLFTKLHQIQPKGLCNFVAGIKTAHLALKHRQNRSHRMRVVLFVGSPMDAVDPAELVKAAKKFKKEKVECDVICFGEADSNNSKLMGEFVDLLNGKEGTGSNLVVVPTGTPLTEAISATRICRGEDGGNAIGGGAAGFEFDPEEDPDLALALRVSMEEERARQAAANAANEGGATVPTGEQPPDVVDVDMAAMTEEEQLEWALRMSMQQDAPASEAVVPEVQAESMDVDVTTNDNVDDLINNPDLLQQIVNDLPTENKKKDDSK